MGKLPVIRTVATLAHDCRRTELFQRELIAALRIVQRAICRCAISSAPMPARSARHSFCLRREQGALSRFAMAHFRPASQPALERGQIRPASKWCAFSSRRLAVTVRCYTARAMEQGEIGLPDPAVLAFDRRRRCLALGHDRAGVRRRRALARLHQ